MSVDHATADFGMRTYQVANTLNGSILFSPFSILMALSMTYLGSSGNTKEQMKSALFSGNVSDEELERYMAECTLALTKDVGDTYQLYMANRMFGDASLRVLPAFRNAIKTYFSADLELISFSETEKALKRVNDWVSTETMGKIENLLPPDAINPLTRLVLANAIYFKSNWKNPFSASNTKAAPFYVAENQQIQVQMMHDRRSFLYAESDDLQVLGIPYTNDALAMYVLLPKIRFALKRIIAKLTGRDLLDLIDRTREKQLEVILPKFKVEHDFDLKTALKNLGIVDLFEMEKADLTKIAGTKDLFVSGAFHKAFIEVNEKGSEAAAATAVVSMLRSISVPTQPLIFRADQPFLYVIADHEKKVVLFMGEYRGHAVRSPRNVPHAM